MDTSTFSQQVRQALEHLHDFAYLQGLALTRWLSRDGDSPEKHVRQLRTALLDAIEQMQAPGNLPPRARERRPYAILYGRYVQKLTTVELTEELAISVRQLRRENKRALQAITDLLWEQLSPQLTPHASADHAAPEPPPTGQRRAAAREEVEELVRHAQVETLRLRTLLQSVCTMLDPIAERHRVQLHNQLPNDLPPVEADRVVLRQGLLELLTYAIDYARAGVVRIDGDVVTGNDDLDMVQMCITATSRGHSHLRAGVGLDISQRLIGSARGAVHIHRTAQEWRARIQLPSAPFIPILLMDDNAGLVELFRRYLSDSSYRIVTARDPAEAIDVAQAERPLLMLLDVMMPHQDGWEVLQRLRTAPATAQLPIVICSVLNQPEIARTLGASDYLPKPVTQGALLQTLEHWRQVRARPVARRTAVLEDS